ncbi:hypothetical protein SNE40_007909 [Patella caerulea]|uniref:Uncharacterized protein n=1 Tax=Patella caerulea TaxID=87958 RepID=A0AAN8Q947_PATCE
MATHFNRRLPGRLDDFIVGDMQESATSTPSNISYGSDAKPKLRTVKVGDVRDLGSLERSIAELTLQNKSLEGEILSQRRELSAKPSTEVDKPVVKGQKSSGSGKVKVTKSKSEGHGYPTHRYTREIPQLADLRLNESLGSRAARLEHLMLDEGTESEGSIKDTDSGSPHQQGEVLVPSYIPYTIFKERQTKKAVSGEARSAQDRVKFDVPWPHEYGQTKSLCYTDYDFGVVQLIRGEVYIIHSVEHKTVARARQQHLINLLYLVDKFPFTEIKDFHAEVLRAIERGLKTWLNSFSEEQGRTLVSPSSIRHNNRQTESRSSKHPPICGAYQAGNCNQPTDHYGSYGDKKLLHICRKCVRKGKDVADPSVQHSSKDCTGVMP